MKILKTIQDVKDALSKLDKKIGFVPTMGYLHEGHLSLIKECKKNNDITVVSIFVNPTQFGPNEDFHHYPRDFSRDCNLLEEMDVDFLFFPDNEQIYPPNYATYVEVTGLSQVLCGKSRPTHFRGVTTVVLKLFNIIKPNTAYFGQKDAQQAIILKKMVRDLNMDINILVLPIVRDSDGMALSSRNTYLSEEERKAALALPASLTHAKNMIDEGIKDVKKIREALISNLNKNNLITIDYVEIVTLDGLQNMEIIQSGNTLVACAIKIGETRLIDNFILGEI